MSDERIFTIEEANETLPDLRERLPRMRDARRRLIGAAARISDAVASDGGGVAGSDWFDAQQTVKVDLEYLAKAGILLRDPEAGLVDFPAIRNGESVFLCWRLGEDEVTHFHAEEGGFAGRKPW